MDDNKKNTNNRIMTEEETNLLLAKVKNGDEKEREYAQTELINNNIGFVRYVVNGIIKNFGIDISFMREELVSVGTIGLIKSINAYESRRNVRFLTFASVVIKNEILIFIRNEMKYYMNYNNMNELLICSDEWEVTLETVLEDDNANFVSELIDIETNDSIRKTVLEWGNSKEREAVSLYFGFNGQERLKMVEVARKLNCSESYVSRIIKRALEKMQYVLISKEIIEMPSCYLTYSKKKKRSKKIDINKEKKCDFSGEDM